MTDRPAPVFGLLVAYRPYECTCCGHQTNISTNHTDVCFDFCTNCSWMCSKYPAMIYGSRYYRAFFYIGEPPKPEEFNPHANGKAPE